MAKESRFKGKAGTIYVEESDYDCDVWFEDFHIIGSGKTKVEALEDAVRFTADMNELAMNALAVAKEGRGAGD